ncbi:MAG: hypothetical protein A2273_05770 [Candidatus Edwardsbacteria bacterium RifOxyA12_full_54_48]|nr:MAG: hypothetical protein A2273_05770 [Candidatus Edwardsbacteria bacterium RifOxyA12_full_54_48]
MGQYVKSVLLGLCFNQVQQLFSDGPRGGHLRLAVKKIQVADRMHPSDEIIAFIQQLPRYSDLGAQVQLGRSEYRKPFQSLKVMPELVVAVYLETPFAAVIGDTHQISLGLGYGAYFFRFKFPVRI